METFTAIPSEHSNQFRFDQLIKNNTYAFLHFLPTKESPENLKISISIYEKNNILIHDSVFVLKLDKIKKTYQEHCIGQQQIGKSQKVIFSVLDIDDSPLIRVGITVAVVKIKDGNDDENGRNYINPEKPIHPVLMDC